MMAATTHWRYLTSDSVGAARGLAGDEVLMEAHGRDAAAEHPASLRLYTYRPHCALVGRYQSVADEVNLDHCAERGIEVGRRSTGGGAIIMGPGQLGVAVCAPARPDEPPREALRRYATGVVAGLGELGVEAQFRSKNDLEVAGRKIAGLGLCLGPDGGLLFHASVLIDLDVKLMLEVLRIPGAKVADKGVTRVGERVTTLSRELQTPATAVEVRGRFASGLAGAFGVELVADDFDEREQRRCDDLAAARYGHADWIFQRSAREDSTGSALLKTPEGLLRLHAGLHGESIKSLLIAGDFNVIPPAVTRLERDLKWCRADRDSIGRIVSSSGAAADLGVRPEAVVGGIWKAILSARRRTSHPRRAAGSCYFPDPGSIEAVLAMEETTR